MLIHFQAIQDEQFVTFQAFLKLIPFLLAHIWFILVVNSLTCQLLSAVCGVCVCVFEMGGEVQQKSWMAQFLTLEGFLK